MDNLSFQSECTEIPWSKFRFRRQSRSFEKLLNQLTLQFYIHFINCHTHTYIHTYPTKMKVPGDFGGACGVSWENSSISNMINGLVYFDCESRFYILNNWWMESNMTSRSIRYSGKPDDFFCCSFFKHFIEHLWHVNWEKYYGDPICIQWIPVKKNIIFSAWNGSCCAQQFFFSWSKNSFFFFKKWISNNASASDLFSSWRNTFSTNIIFFVFCCCCSSSLLFIFQMFPLIFFIHMSPGKLFFFSLSS